MGHANSKDLYIRGLKKSLAARGSKVSRDQMEKFLDFVREVCPWFPDKGTVSWETWKKVGKRLKDYYAAHGPQQVPVETFVLWTLIRDCLDLKREGCKLERVKQTGNKKTLPFAALLEELGEREEADYAEKTLPSAASPEEKEEGEGVRYAEGLAKHNKEPVSQKPPDKHWEDLDPQDQKDLVVAAAHKSRRLADPMFTLAEQIKMIQRQLVELKVAVGKENCPLGPQISLRNQWDPRGKDPPAKLC
ncbi:hypothetical protein mRhiFer1_009586 [Rhinolophus ferrumequinum]|uniref:Beta-retroviral matrix protein domain-containing protein n=1 Tax=Rhinolophus ferrumequinum TaxID=59479 RepID=A0A7J7ZQ60_RHIFE|nr:hypothetical protein mRhiFer1_009586 [Rhinolophus ferrumequinum]